MKRAPHPPKFSDIALSNFSSYIKEILADRSFESADDLLSEIQVILASIENAILLDVFAEWMRRLEQYCNVNGNCFE
jgi:hypothetical protein